MIFAEPKTLTLVSSHNGNLYMVFPVSLLLGHYVPICISLLIIQYKNLKEIITRFRSVHILYRVGLLCYYLFDLILKILLFMTLLLLFTGPISDQKCLFSCPSNLTKSSLHSLLVAIFFSHFPNLSQATAIKIQAMKPIQSQCFRTTFNDKYWLVY